VLVDEGRGVERNTEAAAEYLLKGVALDYGEVFSELAGKSASWSPDTLRALQMRLKAAGYYGGDIDAQVGPKLLAALKQWRLLGAPSQT
jgi:hypothetical protein